MESSYLTRSYVSVNDLKNIYCNLAEWYSRDIALKKILNNFDKHYFLTSGYNKKIYVYMGRYIMTEVNKTILGSKVNSTSMDYTTSSDATHVLFCELNSGRKIFKEINNELSSFNKENFIIFLPISETDGEDEYSNYFDKLRKFYLEKIILSDEDSAINSILSLDYRENTDSLKTKQYSLK